MKNCTVDKSREMLKECLKTEIKGIIKEELENVIHKEGGKWKIRGHKGKGNNEKDGDWKADYKSKEDAKAALRAYFANK